MLMRPYQYRIEHKPFRCKKSVTAYYRDKEQALEEIESNRGKIIGVEKRYMYDAQREGKQIVKGRQVLEMLLESEKPLPIDAGTLQQAIEYAGRIINNERVDNRYIMLTSKDAKVADRIRNVWAALVGIEFELRG